MPNRFLGFLGVGCRARLANIAGVDDLGRRYDKLIRQIAELFPEDESLFAFLLDLRVNREEWDAAHGRGRFFFEERPQYAHVERIELIADDADGTVIEVAIHIGDADGNWGEWYRRDGQPALWWPPRSVLPKGRKHRTLGEASV